VLGNAKLTLINAAILAGLIWTVIIWYGMPLAKSIGIKESDKIKMPIFYLILNFFALWIVARFSAFLGFGVISYIWVFILAFIANFIQWGGWTISEKVTSKLK